MSNFTQFKPKMTAAQQRYHLDGTKKIPGYIKSANTVQPQSTLSKLYSKIGLIADGNVFATWTIRTSVTSTAAISWATYANNLFVYFTGADIGTSTDAITFTKPSIPNAINAPNGLTYGSGIYVLCGSTKTSNQQIVTSTNGVTWTQQLTAIGTTSTLNSVVYGGNIFVAAGNAGVLVTSTNGVTWTNQSSGTTTTINKLTYNPNASTTNGAVYAYAGLGGVLYTSTNAISWNTRTSGTATTINSLAYGNGLYVYAGNGGVLASSTDAITWNSRTSGTVNNIMDVRYFDGMSLWWYGTINGNAASSTDAITWTSRSGVTASGKAGSDIQGICLGTNAAISSSKNMAFEAGDAGVLRSAIVVTYDSTISFLVPSTVNFTYTYLNTTPSSYIKKN